ncbi:hypothetical protein EIH07_05405 [Chryseobacterium taklimakanense]|uniref:hypothetical protein n=1 Tax=Chryseobacterium taklimakanense TaxID=536441 RepID=UPI000F5E8274|nr:hypothetical protein [Chryseobacterium taklimakanense]AZI22519.1 hypothetical protein EIH07_05405 [Chryseobacterium taklimakanense]
MKLDQFQKICVTVFAFFAIGFTVQSFTKGNEKKATTSYFYISSDTSAGAYANPNNWDTSGGGGCADGNAPCMINVPEDVTLEEHIGGLSNPQVLAICETRKNL